MIKNKSRPLLLLMPLLLSAGLAKAQDGVNASGGIASGSSGTATYSIGQLVYSTYTGSSGSVAQGVQHAYEIFSVGINETAFDFSLTAFPNPAMDQLILQTSDLHQQELLYQLFDEQGKLLNREQMQDLQTKINMSGLVPGPYFIQVINQKEEIIQSFKIIKN